MSSKRDEQRQAAHKQLAFFLGKEIKDDVIDADDVIDVVRSGKSCREFIHNLTSRG